MYRDATWSNVGRETLVRIWDDELPLGAFIGANPGKANAHRDDATARKYVGFATRWGWGGYVAGNLYQWVATDMQELIGRVKQGQLVNGADPDGWLRQAQPGVVCVAWGNAPASIRREWSTRALEVLQVLREIEATIVYARLNKTGAPAHLSRLPYVDQPTVYATAP